MSETKREFFIWSNSNSAPFFSDSDTEFILAENAEAALARARATYAHPAGLYAMQVYESADAFHKKAPPLATYLCPLGTLRRDGVACKTCGKSASLTSDNIHAPGWITFYCADNHQTHVDSAPFRLIAVPPGGEKKP